MSISLYDISVETYIQVTGAVSGVLAKGRAHCEAQGIDLDEIVETSLYPDMRPFRFQVTQVAHHALGTVEAFESGAFSPNPGSQDADYGALEQIIVDARATLQACDRAAIDAKLENDVVFKSGDRRMPFTAANFVLSFSLPNLYFHATTAYDILRMKGTPVGKRDFMGMPRIKA